MMAGPESPIGKWISILYRYRKYFANRRLDPYGVTGGQYIFLLALSRRDGVSQEELSAHLTMDKTTTAKAVKKLEEGGYIVRRTNAEDKRAYHVFLTPKAHDVLPLIRQMVRDWESLVLEGITSDEAELLERLLQKMATNAKGTLLSEGPPKP